MKSYDPILIRTLVVLLLAAVFITACASIPTSPPPTSVPPTVIAPPAAPTSPLSTAAPSIAASPERTENMKLRITLEERVITATLNDSKTTRDFISLLPLTLTLEDYAGIEKIGYLPRELSTQDMPAASDFTPGDLAYYAPWGNLAIHHHEFGYANGLVILGTIDGGKEALIVPGSVMVTIELVSE